jgi:hypothetical protein
MESGPRADHPRGWSLILTHESLPMSALKVAVVTSRGAVVAAVTGVTATRRIARFRTAPSVMLRSLAAAKGQLQAPPAPSSGARPVPAPAECEPGGSQ